MEKIKSRLERGCARGSRRSRRGDGTGDRCCLGGRAEIGQVFNSTLIFPAGSGAADPSRSPSSPHQAGPPLKQLLGKSKRGLEMKAIGVGR